MDLPTLSPLEELEDGFGGGTGLAASHNPLAPHSAPAGELRVVGMPHWSPEPIAPSWERGESSRSPPANPAWRSWRRCVSAAWERSRISLVSGRVTYL